MIRTYAALFSMALLLGGFSVATADGFTTVLNAPPDSLDSLPFHISTGPSFHFVPSGTQVNLTGLSSSEISFLEVREGGELNYSAEGVNSSARGGVINFFDGGEAGSLGAVDGGKVAVHGGIVTDRLVVGNGEATISGGIVHELVVTDDGGRVFFEGGAVQSLLHVGFGRSGTPLEAEVNITAGKFFTSGFTSRRSFIVGSEGTLNVSGGNLFSDEFSLGGQFSLGSQVNFFGYDFAIDGVPIPGLVSDVPFEVFDRDIVLSGRLSDGSPFSLPLEEGGFLHTAQGAHISVTYAIPEPGAFLLALLGMAGAASGRVGGRG